MKRDNKFTKYKTLLSYIGPFRKRRYFILLLCLASIIVGTILPYFIGTLIDLIQVSAEIKDILEMGMFLIIISIVGSILTSLQNYNWHIYNVEFINYFRIQMLKAALKKDPKFYREANEDFSTRILHDTTVVAQDISIGFPMLILNTMRLLLVLGLMTYMSFKLTTITIIVVPIYILVFNKIDKGIRDESKSEREEFSNLSETVKEILDGIFTIKVYAKENYFLNYFSKKVKSYVSHAKEIKKYQAISYGVNRLVQGLLPISILIIGALDVYNGKMTVGALFAFYAYIDYLYEPINNLSDWYTGLQVTLGMSDRIISFMDNQDSDEKLLKSISIESIDTIDIKQLSFSYNHKDYVFKNLNLNIQKGDIIGVVGPSGTGKSTLFDILLKVWDNYNGEILINGNELRDIEKTDYYKHIGLVSQELLIFQGLIDHNISFDEIDENRFNKCIKLAQLSDFINNKTKDYNIQNKGKNLSGGEKQRVALARALFKSSDILILDEFTSALDAETEDKVVNNIKKYAEDGKIVIMITHRKKPLEICNKVLDLQDLQTLYKDKVKI